MAVWYTSDTHFYHTNIIKYSDRPFSDVNEMNEKMIHNWNQCVEPDDFVYHLGDFGLFRGNRKPEDTLSRLNGKIYLIRGNHDHKDTRAAFHKPGFKELLYDSGFLNGLMNYALMVHKPQNAPACVNPDIWGDSAILLYGHVHEKAPKGLHVVEYPDGKRILAYHVGVDTNDFKPVNQETIEKELRYSANDPAYSDLEVFKVGLPEKF